MQGQLGKVLSSTAQAPVSHLPGLLDMRWLAAYCMTVMVCRESEPPIRNSDMEMARQVGGPARCSPHCRAGRLVKIAMDMARM